MNFDQLKAEQLAIASLQRVYADVEECKRLYQNAGMALPPTLLRFFGEARNDNDAAISFSSIPAPKRAHTPPGVKSDWISISSKDASPTSLTLAILRREDRPISPKDVAEMVREILPSVAVNSVYNLGKRLADDGVINYVEEGWQLADPAMAGILDGDLLWGPCDIFAKTDLAAHRREGILHILALEPTGLQIVQIVEKLKTSQWMKAPFNKDLLKADMQILEQDGKARRRGNSRKWEVVI